VSFLSNGPNILGDPSDCNVSGQVSSVLNVDPLFADAGLADNGGLPQGTSGTVGNTFALKPGSPAIDAAGDAFCPATDQRGVARPQGAHCDLGAFELAIAPTPTPTPTPTATPTLTPTPTPVALTPTPTPSPTTTPIPHVTPIPTPTVIPISTPIVTATAIPSPTPTVEPVISGPPFLSTDSSSTGGGGGCAMPGGSGWLPLLLATLGLWWPRRRSCH
jgi:hypothetical protein